jgi:hypothetical protein
MQHDPGMLAFMSSFDPSEPAILHDRISGNVETWIGEEEADFRKTSIAKPDGTIARRTFVFDGWDNVLGG